MTESAEHDYVQLHIPTKDRDGRKLSKDEVEEWTERARAIFRRFVNGSFVAPLYTVEGDYKTDRGAWIQEPNMIVVAYAPRDVCKDLIDALKRELLQRMALALRQESIQIVSSLYGRVEYRVVD